MIGGESGKCRPSWIGVFCDWSRGGEKEAIFAQIWAVSFMGDVTGSGSENTGSGSQNVKMFYLVRKICLSEFLQCFIYFILFDTHTQKKENRSERVLQCFLK